MHKIPELFVQCEIAGAPPSTDRPCQINEEVGVVGLDEAPTAKDLAKLSPTSFREIMRREYKDMADRSDYNSFLDSLISAIGLINEMRLMRPCSK